MQDTNELTILGLKEALRNRVSELTENYESQIVSLRVQLTQVTNHANELAKRLQEIENAKEPDVQEESEDKPE